MAVMVVYMHRSNIQRIREGKEYRFGKHGDKTRNNKNRPFGGTKRTVLRSGMGLGASYAALLGRKIRRRVAVRQIAHRKPAQRNFRTIKISAMAPTLSRFSSAESWPTTRCRAMA